MAVAADKYSSRAATTNPGFSIEDREDILEPGGRVAGGYSTVTPAEGYEALDGKPLLNLGDIHIDTSLAASVEAIPGNTYLEKINSLKGIYDKLKNGTVQDADVAQVSNGIKFLNLLAAAVQEYESSSAGTAFETFLAFLSEGVVIGADQGAVDIIAGDNTMMSAKLYSSSDIKQAIQKGSAIGIKGVVQDDKHPLYYVVGMKRSTSSSAAQDIVAHSGTGVGFQAGAFSSQSKDILFVDFVVVKIEWQRGNTYKASLVASDGKEYEVKGSGSTAYKLKSAPSGDLKLGKAVVWGYIEGHVYASIPILSTAIGQARTGTEMLNKMVNTQSNDLLKDITNVYRRLRNMELNTQEYVADESTAFGNIDHISAIQADYDEIKKEWNSAFTKMRTANTRTSAPAGQITESKSPLDQLIEAVIKGMTNETK